MMDIRLVAMDMDGTLLGADKRVSEANRRALLRCEARGIKMVLASGRSFESIARIAKEIGLQSPIISSNGARVDASPEGKTLFVSAFSRDQAEKIFRILLESRVYFVAYGRGVMYQNNLDYHPEEERGLNKSDMRIGNELKGGLKIRIERDEALTFREGLDEVLKFVAFSVDESPLERLRARLSEEACTINSSWFDNMEIMKQGTSKGLSLRFLTQYYGLSGDQVMAFGDHFNDYEMLEACAWPVAMENAQPALKKIARIIAPRFDESGVGAVLEKYVLEEKVV